MKSFSVNLIVPISTGDIEPELLIRMLNVANQIIGGDVITKLLQILRKGWVFWEIAWPTAKHIGVYWEVRAVKSRLRGAKSKAKQKDA